MGHVKPGQSLVVSFEQPSTATPILERRPHGHGASGSTGSRIPSPRELSFWFLARPCTNPSSNGVQPMNMSSDGPWPLAERNNDDNAMIRPP
mmetsp:Transcript_1814/g.3303  ORF Transcript_1814/g.3303 Transcript_1814/m.3303 type:complete len:92 (-) Transcript_1814:149-424(-)